MAEAPPAAEKPRRTENGWIDRCINVDLHVLCRRCACTTTAARPGLRTWLYCEPVLLPPLYCLLALISVLTVQRGSGNIDKLVDCGGQKQNNADEHFLEEIHPSQPCDDVCPHHLEEDAVRRNRRDGMLALAIKEEAVAFGLMGKLMAM